MGRIDALARNAAAETHGLIRVGDFVADHDVCRRTVQRRIAKGHWESPLPGVVDVTGMPWTWERQAMAAVLYGPEGTLASHRTAATLHGVLGFRRRGTIEITVPRRARSREVPLRVHSTVHPAKAVNLSGIPTTPLARTALDLAPTAADQDLARVVRQALLRGGLHNAVADDPWFSRAPGARRLRRTVARELPFVELRPETGLEELALEFLRRTDLPPFVTQHQVTIGAQTLRFDFAWPPRRVALEVDGDAAHGDHAARASDAARTAVAAIEDWHIERLTEDDLQDPAARAAVVEAIATRLAKRNPVSRDRQPRRGS